MSYVPSNNTSTSKEIWGAGDWRCSLMSSGHPCDFYLLDHCFPCCGHLQIASGPQECFQCRYIPYMDGEHLSMPRIVERCLIPMSEDRGGSIIPMMQLFCFVPSSQGRRSSPATAHRGAPALSWASSTVRKPNAWPWRNAWSGTESAAA